MASGMMLTIFLCAALSVSLAYNHAQRKEIRMLREELWKTWAEDKGWMPDLACMTFDEEDFK